MTCGVRQEVGQQAAPAATDEGTTKTALAARYTVARQIARTVGPLPLDYDPKWDQLSIDEKGHQDR